jgi:DNA-binding PadR family transcriptional regulator
MERELLMLGLLGQNEMYGYQINEIIETQIGSSLNLTKPTTYRLLQKMADEGWVRYRDEKEGNRPTRRVYDITQEGREQFLEMLRTSLGTYEQAENPSVIGLVFLNQLRKREANQLLQTRLDMLRTLLDETIANASKREEFSILLENEILHLSAEIEWLDGVIEEMR